MVTVTVDWENDAEKFWATIDSKFPEIAAKFKDNYTAKLTTDEWNLVQSVDGFKDGPSHAPQALIKLDRLNVE